MGPQACKARHLVMREMGTIDGRILPDSPGRVPESASRADCPRKSRTTIARRRRVNSLKKGSLQPTGSDPGPYQVLADSFMSRTNQSYAIEPSTRFLFLSSSSKFETIASVVNKRPEMLPAFAKAVRTTLTGSITPALNMSMYLPWLAS